MNIFNDELNYDYLYVSPRCNGPKSAKNAVYINSESIPKL